LLACIAPSVDKTSEKSDSIENFAKVIHMVKDETFINKKEYHHLHHVNKSPKTMFLKLPARVPPE
jgi:hypothetical protein